MGINKQVIYKFTLTCGVCDAVADGGTGTEVVLPPGWEWVIRTCDTMADGRHHATWQRLQCPECPNYCDEENCFLPPGHAGEHHA